MNTFRKIIGPVITIAIAAFISFFAGAACTENPAVQTRAAGENILGDCAGLVVAKVGETNITITDLVKAPQIYMIMEDQFIQSAIIREECAKRGISADPAKVQKKIDDLYNMSGGYEAFMGSIPDTIPKDLVPYDLRRSFTNQVLQEELMKSLYQTEHGPASNDEIQRMWAENGDFYRAQIANENEGMAPEDVTVEMAREKITDDLVQQWQMQEGQQALQKVKDSYTVQNFLLDSIVSIADEVIDVPVVNEQALGDMGAELVDEHGHAPHETAEEHQESDTSSGDEGTDEHSEDTEEPTDE